MSAINHTCNLICTSVNTRAKWQSLICILYDICCLYFQSKFSTCKCLTSYLHQTNFMFLLWCYLPTYQDNEIQKFAFPNQVFLSMLCCDLKEQLPHKSNAGFQETLWEARFSSTGIRDKSTGLVFYGWLRPWSTCACEFYFFLWYWVPLPHNLPHKLYLPHAIHPLCTMGRNFKFQIEILFLSIVYLMLTYLAEYES